MKITKWVRFDTPSEGQGSAVVEIAAVAATGTAGLQLPVRAPRGRFGLRTSLALSYDSGAGNGPFGPGRHLDSRRCCARVLRKTGKGLPWGASPGGGGVRSGFITP
ncbi:SpvB/TcaC N-terminal domain-containing protein [Streptomyces sp. NPDC004059]